MSLLELIRAEPWISAAVLLMFGLIGELAWAIYLITGAY